MRVAFYIKIFIAFIIFATVLLTLFFFLSKNFYQNHYENLSAKTFTEFLDYKKKSFTQTLESENKRLRHLIHTTAFKQFINSHKEDALLEILKNALLSNDELLEYKIINKFSQELLSVSKQSGTLQVAKKSKLSSALERQEFFEVLKLQDNNIWHSYIKLDTQHGQLQYPIKPVLKSVISKNGYFVIAVMDAQKLLQKNFQLRNYHTFIISNEGDFLLHANSKYNWSKYFYPKLTLKNLYSEDYSKILKYNAYLTNGYIAQRVYIDSSNYFIVLMQFDQTIMERFKDTNYIIIVIGIILSIVLALLFSNPIARLNKQLEQEKESLNLSVIENVNLLGDSLALIDKYVMYVKLDTQFKIIDASAYYCEISGYDKWELIGQNYQKVLSQEVDFELIKNTISKGEVYSGEIKNVKKFAEEFWLASNFEPSYDEKNNIVGYTAICNNITYQKKIHSLYNDLNNQIEQLNAIFQNAKSGIALLDYEGNFQNINIAFCDLLHFSKQELENSNLFKLALQDQHDFLNLMMKQAKEFGSMSDIEVVLQSKNKEYVHLNISFSLMPDKTNIVLVANSLEDKRKLQELNLNLEQRVQEEVTKNIAQEKLHQEQQIKNAKLTSIGTLAAGITHEINTPLTYLKGNFELMQYDIEDLPDDCVQKQNMLDDSVKITEAINRIANIVESMREMSQTSSEAKDKTNIYATLITSLTMAYNRSKLISRIYLNDTLFDINNINKNAHTFYAKVQKQRIEQVWVIIVNNALDELHKIEDYEQRVLHINIFEQEGSIVVRFKDNAGGINEKIIHKIFEPFVSSKEHSGMGVGLNIAKKIVDEQEAKILAYNQDDGAVFEVQFEAYN